MQNQTWTAQQISAARKVPFDKLLDHLGAYHKRDRDYAPLDPTSKSVRVHVNCEGRDFRFIFTGEQFVNELNSSFGGMKGGGGAIDFVRHLTGVNFVQAVKACLDAG
jgi:hypothetical protein